MKRIASLLSLVLCCSTAMSWEVVDRDRVESVSVERHGDGRLDVVVECQTGIGSVELAFDDPVEVDSLRLVLHYESGTPFRFCESLAFRFSGDQDDVLSAENHSGVAMDEDGAVTVPVSGPFLRLCIGWIDYFRE
jgi:hypothetical protein